MWLCRIATISGEYSAIVRLLDLGIWSINDVYARNQIVWNKHVVCIQSKELPQVRERSGTPYGSR
ncbi:hypothetical protein RSAG8_01485, partial [Rhizoctonia solani AG-8 WAC10335]